jgi:hypothetical protein
LLLNLGYKFKNLLPIQLVFYTSETVPLAHFPNPQRQTSPFRSGMALGTIYEPATEKEMKMPDYSKMYGGRFLSATDIDRPFTAVVRGVELEEMKTDDGRVKERPVVHLKDHTKGIVLNQLRYLSLPGQRTPTTGKM